jgi:hypothetical protein
MIVDWKIFFLYQRQAGIHLGLSLYSLGKSIGYQLRIRRL